MRSCRPHGFVTALLALLLGLSVVIYGVEASAMLGKMAGSGLSGSGQLCEACGDTGLPSSDQMDPAMCYAACLGVGFSQLPAAAAWTLSDSRAAVLHPETSPPTEWQGTLDPSPPKA